MNTRSKDFNLLFFTLAVAAFRRPDAGTAALLSLPPGRRHAALQMLLLLQVALLQLLRLLLVLLFHPLRFLWAGSPLRQLLMFSILLLLKFLPVPILLLSELVLLPLVLLVRLRVAAIDSGTFHGRKLLGMNRGPTRRPSSIRRMVGSARFPGRDYIAFEIASPFGGSDRRPASIRRGAKLRVTASFLNMLHLG